MLRSFAASLTDILRAGYAVQATAGTLDAAAFSVKPDAQPSVECRFEIMERR